ncbi:MAG TPA: nicotinate phosphoribosyltransferase, partial [Gammaproteobacteria bacterium]
MSDAGSALLTDLYQLTMLQGYQRGGMRDTAVFELFVRRLPQQRQFVVAAGLAQLLDYLEQLHFGGDELEWLASTGRFDRGFLDQLASFRFTGDVDAMPEGTVCFADEPLLRVTAALPEAQFIESRLINLVHLQTLIASKAVRCVLAAPGRQLVDFGMRRAHGAEAATLAARAAYLAGFTGTATLSAGREFGIPVFGTMAHSFVQAHADERTAFLDFALSQPDNVVLLIDTYDVEQGAREVVGLAGEFARHGIRVKAVRIDSGDLRDGARRVRAILDAGGMSDTGIFCSGNLDEYQLARLVAAGAPIDGYGIGTHMTTSHDLPSLDCAYKLQEYDG